MNPQLLASLADLLGHHQREVGTCGRRSADAAHVGEVQRVGPVRNNDVDESPAGEGSAGSVSQREPDGLAAAAVVVEPPPVARRLAGDGGRLSVGRVADEEQEIVRSSRGSVAEPRGAATKDGGVHRGHYELTVHSRAVTPPRPVGGVAGDARTVGDLPAVGGLDSGRHVSSDEQRETGQHDGDRYQHGPRSTVSSVSNHGPSTVRVLLST